MPIPKLNEKNACPNAFRQTSTVILLKSGLKKNINPSIEFGSVSDFKQNTTSNTKSNGMSTFDNFSMPFLTPKSNTTKLIMMVTKVQMIG